MTSAMTTLEQLGQVLWLAQAGTLARVARYSGSHPQSYPQILARTPGTLGRGPTKIQALRLAGLGTLARTQAKAQELWLAVGICETVKKCLSKYSGSRSQVLRVAAGLSKPLFIKCKAPQENIPLYFLNIPYFLFSVRLRYPAFGLPCNFFNHGTK